MRTLFQTAILGAASGFRSMAGPALISQYLMRHQPRKRRRKGLLGVLASPVVVRLLAVAFLGELGIDKLPMMPDRIKPLPLLGRAWFGALSGGTFTVSRGRGRLIGMLVGGAAAVAGAFGGFYLRRELKERLTWPDAAAALVEDAIVTVTGLGLLSMMDRDKES